MNDLRLLLLIIGVAVVAGIYVWGEWQSRKQLRQQNRRDRSTLSDPPAVKIASKADSDIDYSSALAGLSQSISAARRDEVGLASAELRPAETEEFQQADEDDPSAQEDDNLPEHPPAKKPAPPQSRATPAKQQIISLFIIPRAKKQIEGPLILASATKLDMHIGDMQIFHHYGVGEMKLEQALFSLANMLEPGSFDLAEMEGFSTPGLVMFMCTPTLVEEQVVFELMLNTAQRMAEMLSADVCDENRNLLSEQKIEIIRQSMSE